MAEWSKPNLKDAAGDLVGTNVAPELFKFADIAEGERAVAHNEDILRRLHVKLQQKLQEIAAIRELPEQTDASRSEMARIQAEIAFFDDAIRRVDLHVQEIKIDVQILQRELELSRGRLN